MLERIRNLATFISLSIFIDMPKRKMPLEITSTRAGKVKSITFNAAGGRSFVFKPIKKIPPLSQIICDAIKIYHHLVEVEPARKGNN